MYIRKPPDIPASEITPPALWHARRRFLAAGAALLVAPALRAAPRLRAPRTVDLAEPLTAYRDVTHYNNYYEFGADKESPAKLARALPVRPWTLRVEGLCARPTTWDIDDLLKLPLEERVYRMRCVEGWSMVIPWLGFPLRELLRRAEPLGSARYVEFVSVHDPVHMPGQRLPLLDWPYREGLRLDEAMHPLTLLALGLYGEVLPEQNGAPVRVVVPWKYGFKSAKAIVLVRLTDRQPVTTWMRAAPKEYGFYANVNPGVDHPRWSQARERRIGEFRKRPTLLFNGYAERVASLYAGMDLARWF